jgi:uncharacterized protein with HEPN domain
LPRRRARRIVGADRPPDVADAVERCLERICEAAARLGDRAAILAPGQPWADIRGMGNQLRHAYDRLDINLVWNAVAEDLPSLKGDAAAALERLVGNNEPERQ